MMNSGVLPAQALRQLIANGAITAIRAVEDAQIQPASLDLRLGSIAYRVRASFLIGKDRKVIDRAKGLLMQRQGLTEQLAFEKLRKAAMDKGLRMGEVAQRMLDAADLLG